MQELVRLRQQQQTTDAQLQAMVQRLQGMEQRQQQMMSFLAKAVNSPGFLAQFMQQPNDNNRRMMEGNKKRRLKQEGVSDDDSINPSDGQIIKYQPMMNEAAKVMLRQIVKLDSSSRLENFENASDSFMNSSSNCVSGVTLQEVPPTSGPSIVPSTSAIEGNSSAVTTEVQSPSLGASAEVVANQFLGKIGTQEMPSISLPAADAILPELSQMVPESNVDITGSEAEAGVFMDPASFPVSGEFPLDIGDFSPNAQMEWENSLLDEIQELPGVSDPFWEKFLQSPPPVETEMDSTLTDDLPEGSETKPLENGWNKSEHMAQLTEQMGLLSPDAKKV
ncbi:hypothetical protein CDL12_04461 [Handroanthus impetiginosus]|uniref:Heat shock transcription factor n=1 Tax=Handroanthus impetiginosus TaxID=429701 RepID=A0A2G9HZA9_9LAMI|nr:hypothetical protein CDL12_04461 [Handroanthus impetiginosus]